MNNLLPIAASCLFVGGAIGFVVGNNGGEDAATENVADKSKPRVSGSSRSAGRSSSGSSNLTAQNSGKQSSYEEVANVPSQTARVQSLVDLYSNMTSEELAEAAEKLKGLPMGETLFKLINHKLNIAHRSF